MKFEHILTIILSLVAIEILAAKNPSKPVYPEYMQEFTRLYEYLFTDYNAAIPAVRVVKELQNTTGYEPFVLTIQLRMFKLIGINESKEKMSAIYEFSMIYKDDRLVWDPKEFSDIDHIYTYADKVWIPECPIVDLHSLEKLDTVWTQQATITNDGMVTIYVPYIIAVVCRFDMKRFPFDKQACQISMVRYSFLLTEFKYQFELNLAKALEELGNSEWVIENITVNALKLIDNDTGIPFNELDSFIIYLKRNYGFYLTMVILPSFIVNTLSIVGIFINTSDLMSKLTICLTSIMSMTFILGILQESMPKTRDLPVIAIYVTVNMVLMVLAIAIIAIYPILKKKFLRWTNKLAIKMFEPRKRGTSCWQDHFSINRICMVIFQTANIANFIYLLA